jgi:RimJ/RimL family protein N-acetyltransferase
MSDPSDDVTAGVQPTIDVGDFLLRPWLAADDRYVIEAFSDPEIRGWSGCRIDSPEHAAKWISQWPEKWRQRTAASWAVVPAADRGRVVGQVALRSLWVGEMAEISYWVMPDHRGQGIAPRATTALASWALDRFDLTRLEIVHSVRNRASCRVALKAGFAPEGIKRSLQRHEIGGVHDMHMHSRVRPAQTRVRTLDTALLGVVSQVKLWLAVSAMSTALMLLTLVSRLALIVPLLVAAGVLSLHVATVQRPHFTIWPAWAAARRPLGDEYPPRSAGGVV